MKQIKHILLLCLLVVMGASCTNDDFVFQDIARVRLVGPSVWTVGSDSLEFSFVVYPEQVTTYQMEVEACLIGVVSDQDRTVQLGVDAEKTTASASQYSFPNTVTIPAGGNKATFPVTLKRDASLTTSEVRLYIKVEESADFGVGNNEQHHLLLKWNDKLIAPKNWESELKAYFGTYSDDKYRFMLGNAGGESEFSTSTMSWAKLNNFKLIFTKALDEYNAAHPENPYTFNFND